MALAAHCKLRLQSSQLTTPHLFTRLCTHPCTLLRTHPPTFHRRMSTQAHIFCLLSLLVCQYLRLQCLRMAHLFRLLQLSRPRTVHLSRLPQLSRLRTLLQVFHRPVRHPWALTALALLASALLRRAYQVHHTTRQALVHQFRAHQALHANPTPVLQLKQPWDRPPLAQLLVLQVFSQCYEHSMEKRSRSVY